MNRGALVEIVLDHPVTLDFNKQSATLWDGGEGAISPSNIPLLAQAVSAVLKQPGHGGIITQSRTLEIAKQTSTSK